MVPIFQVTMSAGRGKTLHHVVTIDKNGAFSDLGDFSIESSSLLSQNELQQCFISVPAPPAHAASTLPSSTEIDIHDLISRINAMRASEEGYAKVENYFTYCSESSDVDSSCRKAMANWCIQVADTLSFSHETVGLAMSFFDRYLSSRRGKSQEALDSRNMFQLAAITCFYIAVKTYEPVELGVYLLAKMCRNFYSKADIIAMECDILFALEWRVTAPTPMDFVRHLIQLLPSNESNTTSLLLESTVPYMDQTANDVQFSFFKPSVIGATCLLSSLAQTNCLHQEDLDSFLVKLSQIIDLTDVTVLQKRFNANAPICHMNSSKTPRDAAIKKRRRSNSISPNSSTSSPICVTARRTLCNKKIRDRRH